PALYCPPDPSAVRLGAPHPKPESAMDMGSDNALLAMLPAGPRSALQPHLTRVSLVQRQILWNTHQPITDVLFPVSALVAIIGQAGKGEDVQVGAVGRFGMVG